MEMSEIWSCAEGGERKIREKERVRDGFCTDKGRSKVKMKKKEEMGLHR